MEKSTKWRIGGWFPIILIWIIWIIWIIILREWKSLAFFILILVVIYGGYRWGKYCWCKEYEAEKEEKGWDY